MRKYYIGLCALLLTIGTVRMAAQTEEPRDIVVTNFQNVVTDLSASVTPVNDNNGDVCAVIKFFVRDTTFVIEPNLGYLRRESKVGEIRLWVPAGTKRLTVRHEGMFPLKDYSIPMPIESKKAYHAYIWSTDTDKPPRVTSVVPKEPEIKEVKQKPEKTPESSAKMPRPIKDAVHGTRFFLAPSFLIAPQTGISMAIGINMNSHIVEAGAAMALSKSDSLYYYKNSVWYGTYRYVLYKAFLKYGYEYRSKGNVAFAYTPMVGVHSSISSGTGKFNEWSETGKTHKLKDGMALSVSAAARVALCVGDHFAWYVKPEYSITAYKSDSYKLMIKGNDVFKKWAEGFSLETGVVVSF